jgi:hypothetical protein
MSPQRKNGYAVIVAIFIFSIPISGAVHNSVFALTDSERYNTGHNWGCSDARKGGHPYLNSHPSHTVIFMNGYNNGYASCSTSKAQNPGTTSSVNRNNMFSDLNLCRAVQKYLTKSCSAYVNSNGVLSTEGKRAKDCITSGIMLTGAGNYLTQGAITLLGPKFIIGVLQPLSESTGCGGIVKWNLLETDADMATAFLKILGNR